MKGPTYNMLEGQWKVVQAEMVMYHLSFDKMEVIKLLSEAETRLELAKRVGKDNEEDIRYLEKRIDEVRKDLVV